ncbi:hypothetical protein KI809_18900 [Geobacter pelophilus]|uniref:Uncharacterized protein n=1 Tax=Geoanaerobacter pelophilus TaxID=60036 RepID=A0AAW4LD78_9BACT|nr:hypothetical protein [Geoanaerobacter pelophilus]MBT0666381.1 hypothetical protein [Geoanaerobacter pelophilus]
MNNPSARKNTRKQLQRELLRVGDEATKYKMVLLVLKKSQADIARELQVTLPAVNGVINGNSRSKRIEEYLEKLVKEAA